MKILRASEDYLEAMLMMKEKYGYIRSIDVADYLGVTKPSVSYATKRLRENGYISMDKSGLITLTEKGTEQQERFCRIFLDTEAVVLRGFSPEERAQLKSLLVRVADNLN